MTSKGLYFALAALFLATRTKAGPKTNISKNILFSPISSGYGNRKHPKTGKITFHGGIDIPTKVGTPITALDSGIVVDKGTTDDGGNFTRIKLIDGYTLGFAHLSKTPLRIGAKFRKSEIVAYSGNSGKLTTGAHIHFTVRDPQGKLIDPRIYLKKYRA